MIFDTATNDCPVSLLNTESTKGLSSLDTVMYYMRVRIMKEASGASPFGGDLNKWPSRLVDAFMLLQDEQSRVDELMKVRTPQHPQNQQPEAGHRHGSAVRR